MTTSTTSRPSSHPRWSSSSPPDPDTAESLLAFAEPWTAQEGRPLARADHTAYGAPFLLARSQLELGRWLWRRDGATRWAPCSSTREVFARLRATPSVDEVDAVRTLVRQAPRSGSRRRGC